MPVKPKKTRRPWEPAPAPKQAGRKADPKFYHSTPWRKTSRAYRQANPLCEECLKNGRTTPVALVDHIKPIEEGGDPLSWDNLQGLCHRCHNRKSGRERHHKRGGKQCMPGTE